MDRMACAVALDMGGTFIKSACVTEEGLCTDVIQTPSGAEADREVILSAIATALQSARAKAHSLGYEVAGIGISTPGPFDYQGKRSLMQHKFQSIHGENLQNALQARGIIGENEELMFMQDANCALAGERAYGAARGKDNCTLVTLGTGLGFSAMANGAFLTNGRGGCYVALYRQPWKDGIIEDVVSARGICRRYQELSGPDEDLTAKQVSEMARDGNSAARQAMEDMGRALGRSVAFHMAYTNSELLVVGGQISKAFDLFAEPLAQALRADGCQAPVRAAVYPEQAALLGAGARILQGA